MNDMVLQGGLVLTPSGSQAADVAISEGKVVAVGEGLEGEQVLDCRGAWVGPGFVDLHTHLREPGQEWKEDIDSGSAAAAAGGYTAVVAMPNTDPPIDSGHLARYVTDRGRGVGLVEVASAGCVTMSRSGERLAHLDELWDAGVRMFSDDGDVVADAGLMRRALEYAGQRGGVIAQHAVDAGLAAGGYMNEGPVSSRLGMYAIPGAAEDIVIARDLALVELTGARYHVQHVATARGVELIAAAKERGLPVTAEVTPHHLAFDDTCGCRHRSGVQDDAAAAINGGCRSHPRGPAGGRHRRRGDRPCSPCRPREGRTVRGGAVRGDRPRVGRRRRERDGRPGSGDVLRAHVGDAGSHRRVRGSRSLGRARGTSQPGGVRSGRGVGRLDGRVPVPERAVSRSPDARFRAIHGLRRRTDGPGSCPAGGGAMTEGVLVTADGDVFRGRSVGARGVATGEVVFNTAMTGYQEIVTDPSYAGQVVVMTAPHIGNYGVNAADDQAARPLMPGVGDSGDEPPRLELAIRGRLSRLSASATEWWP